jgi:carnitine O-acetyltransferase
MSPGDYFYGGFGAVASDGYGICYSIGKEKLKLSISSYKNAKETDSVAFRKTLAGAFNDLRTSLS